MKRERETNIQKYGKLVMRSYTIAGNLINAFYDSADDLVFVLDNTISVSKPNVLLVINPDGDKKWDEILSNNYNVDLEMVRPKQDNKYQKLDIEYSGLSVYDNLIRAYLSDDDMEEYIEQLNVLRDSAARHSAMSRLNAANDIIAKTNITIIKTKESIVNLQERLKTLRAKLSATRKEIGKVSTKQSAAKILRIESQIEATNEKLKRAKKRLESAQRRLESATVDAELASDLLNQPESDISKNKSVVVAPKHEIATVDDDDNDDEDFDDEEIEDDDDDEASDVKPLFEQDPQILNEDIAFKPIEFKAPDFDAVEPEPEPVPAPVFNEEIKTTEKPIIETFEPVVQVEEEKKAEPKPVLDTMLAVEHDEPIKEHETEQYVAPVVPIRPVSPLAVSEPVKQEPIEPVNSAPDENTSKPTFIYYVLLFVLIVLSVFTLWLYQKNIKPTTPSLAANAPESVVVEKTAVKKPVAEKPAVVEPVAITENESENIFLDEAAEEPEPEMVEQPLTEPEEPVEEEYDEEDIAPEIMGDVPARVMTSGEGNIESYIASEEDVIATKPIYEPGNTSDDIFISDQNEYTQPEYDSYDDYFYDAEEAAYQAEQNM